VTRSLSRWIGVALTLAAVALAPAGGTSAAVAVPAPGPAGESGSFAPPSTVLMEVTTGQVLASADPHRRIHPASLDKLMTFYLTLQAIHSHRLALTTEVTVSVEAWRIGRTPGSSRMFLNVGDRVTIEQLLQGLMVASGNDAAETLAEALAGSDDMFVEEMNATAANLGMRDTHFATPHGLPHPGEYTSAWDMGLLARQILVTFPEAVTYASPLYMTYGGIRQANWNNLVFRDPRVDGLKTGFTDQAGFHIVATARQDSMRLIAVVMGAHTLRLRTGVAEELLNLGFARYVLVAVPWQQVVPSAFPVYGGIERQLTLETARPVSVLLTRDDHGPLTISAEVRVAPVAPFRRGQQVGTLTVRYQTTVLATAPLLASSTINRARMIGRLWGMLRYAISRIFHHRQAIWTGSFTPPQ
jgi:D-alanyl-D-alanine carboxypeptidase (penicillin-binding protein 5/6)